MTYQAPIRDFRFVIKELVGLDSLGGGQAGDDLDADMVDAILDHAAAFYEQVLAPTNRSADLQGAAIADGVVRVPGELGAAYRDYAAAGWGGLRFPTEWGGQGLPRVLAAACQEMLNGANLALGSGTLLCDGAIEALLLTGSPEQRALYLPKLVSGEWTGAMNLTEPQAGSDLAQIRTRAVKDGDRYRIFGQKLFITFGDHDMAPNIVHLVLARVAGAPDGIRGLSLFLVPKHLPEPDGTPGPRNDLRAVSIEHKLGLRASPTCLMSFGDDGGAVGWLVGEENRGLDHMFVMMNAARFTVGMQGIGIAQRAYQLADAYARDRVQSRSPTSRAPVAIIEHPDVRRLLMTMAAQVEAARALAARLAVWLDLAETHPDDAIRGRYHRLAEYLVPIHKGHHTEMAVEVASLGIQVHGGVGFTEDCEAAQLYRDARILPIYEGTTAIQANDLVGRKTLRDAGAAAFEAIGLVRDTLDRMQRPDDPDLVDPDLVGMAVSFAPALDALDSVVRFLVRRQVADPLTVHAGAVPYLRLAGQVFGGWQMCEAALVARRALAGGTGDPAFYARKLAVARFFVDWIAPLAIAARTSIENADDRYLRLPAEAL